MRNKDTKGLRFAIYARVSDESQAENESLDAQVASMRKRVQELGGVVADVSKLQ